MGVFILVGVLASPTRTPVYKVTPQHNTYEVGITCQNGGDPAVVGNYDGMLIVSCGKE